MSTICGQDHTSFNGSGKNIVAVGSSDDVAYSVIQQIDAKLVVSGHSHGSNNDYALVRFNGDGSLDSTFNGAGKLVTAVGTSQDYARGVIQRSDGSLVALGYSLNGGNYDFSLVCYKNDGGLDKACDSDGKLLTNISEVSQTVVSSLVRQSDARLVVAGHVANGTNLDIGVARFDSAGNPDFSFGLDGKFSMAIGNSDDVVVSMIQQSDGMLVGAGYSYTGSGRNFSLVRYAVDGSVDTDFNGTGVVVTPFGALGGYANSVIQQPDGKLVAAGAGYSGTRSDIALVRYNIDGSLDSAFNGSGKVLTAVSEFDDYATSLIMQSDGKILVAGVTHNGSNSDFVLVRYNSDGSLDTSFNGTGILVTDVGGSEQALSVIQQLDGKLVVAGQSYNGINSDFLIVRYNTNGLFDSVFNGTGFLILAVGPGNDGARSVIQQADGKLVVVGYRNNGFNDDAVVVRCNSDGSLDDTFYDAGKRVLAFGAGHDVANDIIQQPDGKLVVAGYSANMPSGQELVVARLESGQPDTDNDGLLDAYDVFPLDPAEWLDTDGDGTGNNADMDDDNDGIPDYIDADPLDGGVNQELVLPLDNPYSGSAISESVSP